MKVFLLVDDAPVIRKVANRMLSDFGFIVIEAGDAYDALEKCRFKMPDSIIVDWDMPNMSGVEFIEEFKKLPNSENTKIIYSTSEILVSEMTKAKRAGATGFMMKPFNREILTHKLNELGIYKQAA